MQISIEELRKRSKHIKENHHPTEDLIIWNYTPECQYEEAWDEYTMQARGLITDSQGKKSMAKGGAEKIASIFGWVATFVRDQEAMEAFDSLKQAGIICFVCNLTKDERLIGQGRGAAALAKNGGDPNKTLKMCQKSAFIDAVIRASGLSDFYTQDLEDMLQESIQKPVQPVKTSYKSYSGSTGANNSNPTCPNHNKLMSRNTRGFYCSTRVGEGWCQYKPGQQQEMPVIQQEEIPLPDEPNKELVDLAKDIPF